MKMRIRVYDYNWNPLRDTTMEISKSGGTYTVMFPAAHWDDIRQAGHTVAIDLDLSHNDDYVVPEDVWDGKIVQQDQIYEERILRGPDPEQHKSHYVACGEDDGMNHVCTLERGHAGYHADTKNGYHGPMFDLVHPFED